MTLPPSPLIHENKHDADFVHKLDECLRLVLLQLEIHARRFGDKIASEYRIGHIPSELVEQREREVEMMLAKWDTDTSSDSSGADEEFEVKLGGCTMKDQTLPTPPPSMDSYIKKRRRPYSDEEEPPAKKTRARATGVTVLGRSARLANLAPPELRRSARIHRRLLFPGRGSLAPDRLGRAWIPPLPRWGAAGRGEVRVQQLLHVRTIVRTIVI